MLIFYFMMTLLVLCETVATVVFAFMAPVRPCRHPGCSSAMRASSSSSSSSSSSWDDNSSNALLNARFKELKRSEALQDQLLINDDRDHDQGSASSPKIVKLPVLCMDAMLPKQRLQLRTTDPTLGYFLRDGIGLGGIFVMTSLNPATRLIRRHGVCVKVQALDVVSSASSSSSFHTNGRDATMPPPTAVDFEIVGLCRCRLVGPREDTMRQRIGRWRRGYDPNGEESMLGWGLERFQKAQDELVVSKQEEDEQANNHSDDVDESRPYTEWSTCLVNVGLEQMDQKQDDQLMPNGDDDGDDEDSSSRTIITNQIDAIAQMLMEWQDLASNGTTFENLSVTATTRIQRGQAGLLVNPQVLIKNVLQQLGTGPSIPKESPTAFCYWATAVMNPLPPLGVSLEIRGAMLEAVALQQRLNILQRGLMRSIDNLKGIRPLI